MILSSSVPATLCYSLPYDVCGSPTLSSFRKTTLGIPFSKAYPHISLVQLVVSMVPSANHLWTSLLFHALVSCALESVLLSEIKCYESFNQNQFCERMGKLDFTLPFQSATLSIKFLKSCFENIPETLSQLDMCKLYAVEIWQGQS